MALEDEFKTFIAADATIISVAGARVYTSGTVGRDGLTSESTPEIFNADGDILPTILVRGRDQITDDQITDFDLGESSSLQVVEIYIYEEQRYVNIDIMLLRLKSILHGHVFLDSFEAEWVLTAPRLKDQAALAGASMARQDWSVVQIN